MNGSCNKLFSCSRFTSDKDRRITWRNFGDTRQHKLQSRGSPDDFLKHRGFVDFLPQCHVFLSQSVLVSFAIIDVSMGHIPANDLALVVPDWIEPSEKPTIVSVGVAQPQLPRIGGRPAGKIVFACPVTVVWMNQ